MERTGDALEIELVEDRPDAAEPHVTEHEVEAIERQDVRDEERAEGGEPYFAPTDPVLNGGEVAGGFEETSMDDVATEPSTIDDDPGDEAIADAVRRELREDAATCHLALSVEVRRGVVYLRGAADDLEDTDNAADVASRIAGVRQVVEQIATRAT